MRRQVLAVLTVATALFLAATLPWINHLGLEYDEAHFLPSAVQIAYGAELRIDPPHGVTIAHRPIPLMTMPYVGILDSFLYATSFSILGTEPWVHRATNIALGLAILIVSFWVAHREAGLLAGIFTLALLLVDVEEILHIPTGFGPFLLQQLFTVAALLCLQRFWRTGARSFFYLATALLALAFHEKLTFIWVLTSLAVAILLFEARLTWKQTRWWDYPAGLLLAIVIVSPILYYTYSLPEVVLGFGKANAKAPADWGSLIQSRWLVLSQMLRGNWTMEFTVGPPPSAVERGPALLILFFAGAAASIWSRQRLALMLYTTAFGVWLWNFVFPDAGRMHHILLMAPLWHIAAAIGFTHLKRPMQIAAAALLLWSGVDATRYYVNYIHQSRLTGGINHWSDMTTRACVWLNAHPGLDAVTPNWGIARIVSLLTAGRVATVEHYFDTLSEPIAPEVVTQLKLLIHKERQVWLVSDVMPIYQTQWRRIVDLAGKPPLHLKTFTSRDGRHHLQAFTFTPPPPSPARWVPVSGPEFDLPAQPRLRITIAGTIDAEPGHLNVHWLDATGKTVAIDRRSFHWTPHLRPSSTFEFSPAYWPPSFRREPYTSTTPSRIRIESNMLEGRIQSIEVPAP